MLYTTNTQDAFRGRTAHIEYDNAIQYAGTLRKLEEGETRVDILPGMVVKHIGNKVMDVYDGTGTPFGLASIFVAPGFGKSGLNQLGMNDEFTAIVGTNNTTVRVDKEALDPDASFVLDETGKAVPLYANAKGRITSTAGAPTAVIGNLLEVGEDGSIVIQLKAPEVVA